MPTFYEGGLIADIKNQITDAESYAAAFVYAEKSVGHLKYNTLYTLLFAATALVSGFNAYKDISVSGMIIKCVICALALAFAVYFAWYRVRKVELRVKLQYDKSPLLISPVSMDIYRDSFKLKNEYECFDGYWTDIVCGYEDGKRIVLVTQWLQRPIVIVKNESNSDSVAKISRHLRNTLTNRYKVK